MLASGFERLRVFRKAAGAKGARQQGPSARRPDWEGAAVESAGTAIISTAHSIGSSATCDRPGGFRPVHVGTSAQAPHERSQWPWSSLQLMYIYQPGHAQRRGTGTRQNSNFGYIDGHKARLLALLAALLPMAASSKCPLSSVCAGAYAGFPSTSFESTLSNGFLSGVVCLRTASEPACRPQPAIPAQFGSDAAKDKADAACTTPGAADSIPVHHNSFSTAGRHTHTHTHTDGSTGIPALLSCLCWGCKSRRTPEPPCAFCLQDLVQSQLCDQTLQRCQQKPSW